MSKDYKICVLGGGSFGTVLANLAASKGHDVSLWVKDSDKALRINSESKNTQYHPELKSRPLKPHPLFISFIKNCKK